MDMELITRAAAAAAVLGTGVVYGTDVFCAMVMRPALAHLNDQALVALMGHIHRFGDHRMPAPGVVGIAAAVVSAISATLSGHVVAATAAAFAVAALAIWLLIYVRRSAPINRQLTAAAEAGRPLPDARALQAKWDSVITARAALQGLAVAALCVALMA